MFNLPAPSETYFNRVLLSVCSNPCPWQCMSVYVSNSVYVLIPVLDKFYTYPTSLQSRLLGKISIISDIHMISPLWQKVKNKEHLDESEKASLKLNIQKMKIMAPGPITPWQIDGEIMETVTDFIFLGSRITADDDCSHESKRCLLLGRKTIYNLDSILKSRDITLPTKFPLVKAMIFPVDRYQCES